MTCVLASYHLEAEWGESGPALALLYITHSTVSTSQPSILDSGDNNYLYRAGEETFLIFVLAKQEAHSRMRCSDLNNSSLY